MAVSGTAAPIPADDEERLADLYAYAVLDTDPEESFDDIVRLAAEICGTPWAGINFIAEQRQWTKAVIGIDLDEMPREAAFCSHTIVAPDGILIVEDATADARFQHNPLVREDPNVRFYAGSAIRSSSGRPVGAVCVLDSKPQSMTPAQVAALDALSRLATSQLELRRLLTGQRQLVDDLRHLDQQKAELHAVVAHDFRTPLTAIRGYAEMLRDGEVDTPTAIDAIERGSGRLLRLVDDLTASGSVLEYARFDLAELVRARR